MSLWSSIGKLQKDSSRFYIKLAQRFKENSLIRETWSSMAQDLEHQAASLREVRPSAWKLLKKEEKAILSAVNQTTAIVREEGSNSLSQWSLLTSLNHILECEEPLTLRIYAPLIFHLRTHWSNRGVDFYVMANAHLTRLSRLIQGFSGDPSLIQRCAALQNQFERGSQGPKLEVPVMKKRVALESIRSVSRVKNSGMTAKHPSRLAKRAQPLRKPAKRIIKRIALRRAQARS